jgi:hypothetical protein
VITSRANSRQGTGRSEKTRSSRGLTTQQPHEVALWLHHTRHNISALTGVALIAPNFSMIRRLCPMPRLWPSRSDKGQGPFETIGSSAEFE